ncbi:hypothetical protein PGT21_025354 [Puccinia graminis f. sp. tritici]|uniref:RING-type domain-containing protein n=1 Tax=Puccinia graminis f. sp. tritici TaxID=56615 RepID=A0A5B0RAC8_PUCGR|nr:hypothetical protein PGT21_025354 [Puccinia graminis f. sp. tritici]KAA1122342.1 hypothetical protein PGTUg99_036824 [Puccinia graminis f. sp. tritici]
MFSIHIFVVALILEAIISTPFIPAPDKTASVGSHDLLKSINYHMKRSLEEGGSSSITCSICHAPMSDDEVRCWPNCQHPFHSRCIGPWFVIPGSTCPLCRGSGSKIEGTTGQENSLQNPNTVGDLLKYCLDQERQCELIGYDLVELEASTVFKVSQMLCKLQTCTPHP